MQISKGTKIHGSLDEYLELTQNPDHWIEWHAGFNNIDSINGHGESGSHIEGNYSILGIKFPVSIDVEEASSEKWLGKVHGPFELTYVYNIADKKDELEITAEI